MRVSPADAELHTAAAVAAAVEDRAARRVGSCGPTRPPVGRLLKRANSCLAIGDPGLPLADAAGRGVGTSTLPATGGALAQVEPGSAVEAALAGGRLVAAPGGRRAYLVALGRPGWPAGSRADLDRPSLADDGTAATSRVGDGRGRPAARRSTATGWGSTAWRSTRRTAAGASRPR